jgi:regulator of PEP synthase PpsR (kinase-PPPase family)
MPKRSVFFLSDRTGITAETLGHSLLTQFEGIEFRQVNIPFLDSREMALKAVERINLAAELDGEKPIIFSTLLNDELRDIISQSEGQIFDFFETFINPLESVLNTPSAHAVGRSHGIKGYDTYKTRIDAVNFALRNDDGTTTRHYPDADIILIGVSRSGKTPTCLYLALQYGIHAANYPLTEEDLDVARLPEALTPFRGKLFGLTIDAERLHQIRNERRKDSRYASREQCQHEVKTVEQLYRKEQIPFLDTSNVSIEEIATIILHQTGIERRLYG